MKRYATILALTSLLFLLPKSSYAKNFKIGLSFGGGFVAGQGLASTGIFVYPPLTYKLTLPSVEFRILLNNNQSFDIQFMLGNLIHGSIYGALFGKGSVLLPIQIGIYYGYRIGRKTSRFVIAPGGQVELLINSAPNFFQFALSLNPAVRLGLEVTTSTNFTFELRAVPFLVLGIVSGVYEMFPLLFGVGVVGEFAFYF